MQFFYALLQDKMQNPVGIGKQVQIISFRKNVPLLFDLFKCFSYYLLTFWKKETHPLNQKKEVFPLTS